MGGRIIALARDAAGIRVTGAVERPGHPALGRDAGEVAGAGHLGVPIADDPGPLLGAGRVLVEFTAPEASLEHLRLDASGGAGAVVGTTGFQAAQVNEVRRLATSAPILLSPNMSVGVNLAFRVLALMAKALGDDYDVEITEIHHRMKKDAPSGTAAKMAEVVAEALGRRIEDSGRSEERRVGKEGR